MIEEVTATELAAMANVKAVLVDKEWFQVYDNLNKFTEVYVSSGLYWNYNYHVWKTVSYSPFSNAVVFIAGSAASAPASLDFVVQSISGDDNATVYTFVSDDDIDRYNFEQDSINVSAGIAIHPYGAVIVPSSITAKTCTLIVDYMGEQYSGTLQLAEDTTTDPDTPATVVGDKITFSKVV